MAAHAVNQVYCCSVGDYSQVDWSLAPEVMRQSVLNGVDAVFAGKGPRQLHENWLQEKIAAGWVHDAVKCFEKKTHPCLVAYDELPDFDKRKDVLFLNTVHMMASALGHPVPHVVPVVAVGQAL